MTTTATTSEPTQAIREYWEEHPCESWNGKAPRYSEEYFRQIEEWRYKSQPFIHSFAQFTRYHGKRVLEIGVGTGTDLLQFARAGASVTGVDLTEEAIEHARHRLLPKFSATTRLHQGRVETLPFESNSFDLAYSWGVLHHTENTEVSLKEVVRTVAPGGEVKIMLYNRYSICTLAHWVKYALFRGQPWRSFRWILAHHLESPGTRAYTRGEIRGMISRTGLKLVSIETVATPWDYLPVSRLGFFHMIRAAKP